MSSEMSEKLLMTGLRLNYCRKTDSPWPACWGKKVVFAMSSEDTLWGKGREKRVEIRCDRVLETCIVRDEDRDPTYLEQSKALSHIKQRKGTLLKKRAAVHLVSFNTRDYAKKVEEITKKHGSKKDVIERIRNIAHVPAHFNSGIQAAKRNALDQKKTHLSALKAASRCRPSFKKKRKQCTNAELYRECAKLGDLGGKTLFRLLERRCVKNSRYLRCFDKTERISLFKVGPKKLFNLVFGNDLLEDTKRLGPVAACSWNRKMGQLIDKTFKFIRKDAKLKEYYGEKFSLSPFSMDGLVFIYCETMGFAHYVWNLRKKSVRDGCKKHHDSKTFDFGRRVVDGDDQNGEDEEEDEEREEAKSKRQRAKSWGKTQRAAKSRAGMGPKVSQEEEKVVSSAPATTAYASASYMMTSDDAQNLDVQPRARPPAAPAYSHRSQDAPPGVHWHVGIKAWVVTSYRVENGRKRKTQQSFHVKRYLDSAETYEKADSLAREAAIQYRDKEVAAGRKKMPKAQSARHDHYSTLRASTSSTSSSTGNSSSKT